MKYIFFILLLTETALSAQKGKTPEKNIITPGMVKEWVSSLASDAMNGRQNGSAEMVVAAGWIAEKFEKNGVKPLKNIDYILDYSYASRQNTINERNVIGIIPGSDPSLKNEYIVLSAHFDHIGIRKGSQDSICNGADDNATGIAALIGIAKYIKDTKAKPGRTIIFAAFSGEENGMRGSRAFVSKFPFELKKVYFDMNFEMIGHSDLLGKNKYYMTGTKKSNIDDVIATYDRNTEFSLVDTIEITERLFFQSDNVSFSRLSVKDNKTTGVPSGTFATSTMASYLHTPDDEVELCDFDNMASLVNHFSRLVIWLSDNKSEIIWTDPTYQRP
jgi:Zn-dependent M28 family amino/carboxypeptidase